MTQVSISPIDGSPFSIKAESVSVSVTEHPVLDAPNPLQGEKNAVLDVNPILLVSRGCTPELLNPETVAYALKRHGTVKTFIAYEISREDLPPGAERLLEWVYRKAEPCYELPHEHHVSRERLEEAILMLMNEPLLQQFIRETIFPNADPLKPASVRRLFNNKLGESSINQYLRRVRSSTHCQEMPSPSVPTSQGPPDDQKQERPVVPQLCDPSEPSIVSPEKDDSLPSTEHHPPLGHQLPDGPVLDEQALQRIESSLAMNQRRQDSQNRHSTNFNHTHQHCRVGRPVNELISRYCKF